MSDSKVWGKLISLNPNHPHVDISGDTVIGRNRYFGCFTVFKVEVTARSVFPKISTSVENIVVFTKKKVLYLLRISGYNG